MISAILEYTYTVVTASLLLFFLKKSFSKLNSEKNIIKEQILHWIFFGIIFNLFSLSFLYTVYPLQWMEPGVLQLLGILTLHLILSFVSGIPFAIIASFFLKEKRIKKHLKPFVFSLLLSFSEILRSLLLSLIFYGNGEKIGLHWGSGTIGNGLSTTPFIEYAYFGGVYMLTFIFGYISFILLSKKNIKNYWGHGILLIVILTIIHSTTPIKGPNKIISVGVITTNFEEPKIMNDKNVLSYFNESSRKIDEITKTVALKAPTIIVYPEDTNYIPLLNKKRNEELLPYFKNTLFIDGSTKKKEGGYSNRTIFYNPLWSGMVVRDKVFLMPFSEYVPTFFNKLFTFFISGDTLKEYKEKHTYKPEKTMKIFSYENIKIGTIICSEILSFNIVNSLKKEGADIIFYQTHLNVFHNNPLFVMHMRSFTKIAAAQLRTPLIGSSNNAPSFIISPYGKIVETIKTGFSYKEYFVYKDVITPK